LKRKSARPIKYADGLGNTWVGYGKPPVWFQAALKAGRTKDELLVKGGANGTAPRASVSPAAPAPAKGAAGTKKKVASKGARKGAPKKGTGKKAGVVRYRDDQGNTWSGFGPQPRWLKAALASGKSLAELAA
jgi:DNA-binding protein H-NS